MRGLLRYVFAMLAIVLLLGAASVGLAACVTTEGFAQLVLGSARVQAQQQAAVDAAAEKLTQQWSLSPAVLAAAADGAAQRHNEALTAWWGDLWRDPEADPCMPMYLDAARERELVAAVMADEGFMAATDADQRRAIARDEVVYLLDEAVCDAVTPLRRSLVDMALTLAAERVELFVLRKAAIVGAAAASGLALAFLLLARRVAGCTLVSAALSMAVAASVVWMLDVPGMLAQLNPLAASQGAGVLLWMGVLWGGMALVLLLAGLLILRIKRALRERADEEVEYEYREAV